MDSVGVGFKVASGCCEFWSGDVVQSRDYVIVSKVGSRYVMIDACGQRIDLDLVRRSRCCSCWFGTPPWGDVSELLYVKFVVYRRRRGETGR